MRLRGDWGLSQNRAKGLDLEEGIGEAFLELEISQKLNSSRAVAIDYDPAIE